jgi:hypothetical protein
VAPYPVDYIIDRNGFVRHWAAEYDPQALFAVIDGLLAATDVPDAPLARGPWLGSVVPNPFSTGSSLSFRLRAEGIVDLAVLDVLGRRIRTLASGERGAGRHDVTWNGLDERGRPVASGVYFFQLRTERDVRTRRAVLLR